jgi:hypothetical protein
MIQQPLKPTWEELKEMGLIRRTNITGVEFITTEDVQKLLLILRKDYNELYVFTPTIGQVVVCKEEYERIPCRIDESVHIISYEETKTREEIIRQLGRRIRQQGGNNLNR